MTEYRELVLVPTNSREGRLLGLRPGRDEPVVDVSADRVRSTPVSFGSTVIVQASKLLPEAEAARESMTLRA